MATERQPVPTVTDADVDRIVRRDFSYDEHQRAIALLARYGSDDWHREAVRVRLAVLKLADGDMTRLEREVEVACRDYRDVLAPAEYPEYCAKSIKGRFGRGQRASAIASDWQQYSQWLQRTEPKA